MSIEAVIFDIGGVLEVTPRTGWQDRWADKLSLETGEIDRRLEPVWRDGSIGAISLAEVERRVAGTLDLDSRRLAAFMGDLWHEYLGTLNAELAEFFASLRPRFRTGILSNSFVGARERERAAYRFEDMCDAVVYSHEEGLMKPDPSVYEIACRRVDTRPEFAAFLDDVQACVDGAAAVGMTAIRYLNNHQAISDLTELLRKARA